ncbi:MAG TPA: tetratricopeptide repeat protein [Streptosporangiaceae bacterium]|nr:tetratricopeptide repeat protein [Streptosporangiaceae bacterium]
MQQPRNFSLHGAVDLGARQTAAQRRQQVAQSPESGGSGVAIEVTDETFNTEVVARSRAVPVIVDLWAQWCEPCKQLGPVLEKLAVEAAGAWVLAKVDVDASPQLSAALQVQSIPMVVAVIGGQLVDGFLGALPEAQVREWLGQIMQLADQLGLPARGPAADAAGAAPNGAAGAAVPSAAEGAGAGQAGAGRGPAGRPDEMLADPGFRAAQEAMDSGDIDGAVAALERVLASSPGHPVATAWLAQIELIRRVNSYDQTKVRQAARDHPDDPQAQARAADLELAAGQAEASFDRMLGVFQRTAGQDREKARLHLLSLFEILPPRDPSVAKARARLSSLLF